VPQKKFEGKKQILTDFRTQNRHFGPAIP